MMQMDLIPSNEGTYLKNAPFGRRRTLRRHVVEIARASKSMENRMSATSVYEGDRDNFAAWAETSV